MDKLSRERRSWNMSRIRGVNTKPELRVRSMLHKKGFRFRIHRKDLPGKPDIVLPRVRTIVFVNGCFWHRHRDCTKAYTPKTRSEFWQKKFTDTLARDERNFNELSNLGWRVVVIWECQTTNSDELSQLIDRLDLDQNRKEIKEEH